MQLFMNVHCIRHQIIRTQKKKHKRTALELFLCNLKQHIFATSQYELIIIYFLVIIFNYGSQLCLITRIYFIQINFVTFFWIFFYIIFGGCFDKKYFVVLFIGC